MTKRSTSKTSIVSLASLSEAGITEFKLTKEDVIDLLVSEATASVEAEIAAYDAETARIEAEYQTAIKAAEQAVLDWYATTPIGAAFIAEYPSAKLESFSLDGLAWDGNCNRIITLRLNVPEALRSAYQSAVDNCSWYANRYAGRVELTNKLYQAEHSTKKLKTQLVRKILAGSETGANVLSNVKGLSTDFLAALTTSNTRDY